MSRYADIIARLEAATGPDEDLDFAVTQIADTGAIKHSSAHEAYTASLDAAIGLVERMLPGCEISITDTHSDFLGEREHRHCADIAQGLFWVKDDGFPVPDYKIQTSAMAPTRPTALLIAMFRALEAEAKT